MVKYGTDQFVNKNTKIQVIVVFLFRKDRILHHKITINKPSVKNNKNIAYHDVYKIVKNSKCTRFYMYNVTFCIKPLAATGSIIIHIRIKGLKIASQ